MKKKYIFGIIFLAILLISFVVATIDKTKEYDPNTKTIIIYDENLKKLAEYKLISNECDSGFRFCNATIETKLHQNATLSDDIDLYRIIGGELYPANVRWIEYYYDTTGQKITIDDYGFYNTTIGKWVYINESVESYTTNESIGNYTFTNYYGKTDILLCKLNQNISELIGCDYILDSKDIIKTEYGIIGSHEENLPPWSLYIGNTFENQTTKRWLIKAEKRPSWSYEWIAKVLDNIYLSEWAIWGNISTGDDAEVILNSPADDSISLTNTDVFNCSANVTNGATLTNMSLWGNFKGTWLINETINGVDGSYIYDEIDDSSINASKWTVDDSLTSSDATEGVDYLQLYTDFGADGTLGNDKITSNSFLSIGNVENVTIRIRLEKTTGADPDNDIRFLFGGIEIKTIDTVTSDDSVWIIRKNDSEGVNGWSVYDDGIYSKGVITDLTTLRIENIKGQQLSEEGSARIYYVYYYGTNPYGASTTQTFTKTITQDTNWTCSAGDSDGVTGFSESNFTILLNTPPQITINSPSSSETTNNITMNFTFTDDLSDLSYCSYNVTTSGLGVTVADNEINCTDAIEYQTISDGVGYILNVFANDSIGNENSTSLTFTIDTTVPPVTPGGGGSSVIISTNGELLWSMETETGGSKYDLQMVSGSSRTKGILFENLGDESRVLKMSCEDLDGSICKYIEFKDETTTLPVQKEIKIGNEFTINLPEVEKGIYIINIVAVDDLLNAGKLTVEINVGGFGIFSEFWVKMGSSFSIGKIKFPYAVLFFFVFGSGIFLSQLMLKKVPLGLLWSILLSFLISTVVIFLV